MNANTPRVLVVDDEEAQREVIAAQLAQGKIDCITAESGQRALEIIAREEVGVVLTDNVMDGMSGLELLARVREIEPSIQVVLVTGKGSDEIGAKAFELGAAGYVRKPFDRAELLFAVKGALATYIGARPEAFASPTVKLAYRSEAMKQVMLHVSKVAPTDASVLLLGPSGAGKELVARSIHERSSRASGPFIKLVCTDYPETLVDAALFGWEKGAFAGAIATTPGRFEVAKGGTIFLDEIGEAPPYVQVKLLRVLEDRELVRLGGTKTIKLDVRVIAATHRDLTAMKNQGTFRLDLHTRLDAFRINIPPLCDRPDDIEPIAHALVAQLAAEMKKKATLTDGALVALREFSWPGNAREMRNVLQRLIILSDGGVITEADARAALREKMGDVQAKGTITLAGAVARAEKEAIARALETTGGNKTRAAQILDVALRTLHNKIDIYGMRE